MLKPGQARPPPCSCRRRHHRTSRTAARSPAPRPGTDHQLKAVRGVGRAPAPGAGVQDGRGPENAADLRVSRRLRGPAHACLQLCRPGPRTARPRGYSAATRTRRGPGATGLTGSRVGTWDVAARVCRPPWPAAKPTRPAGPATATATRRANIKHGVHSRCQEYGIREEKMQRRI